MRSLGDFGSARALHALVAALLVSSGAAFAQPPAAPQAAPAPVPAAVAIPRPTAAELQTARDS
ncbi:MAG TPA: hypothetical protein VFO94_13625, partial [Gammaproteobacteria bacterium]|nr:hypothetical protein [Gammaproteobacteria bacterium]